MIYDKTKIDKIVAQGAEHARKSETNRCWSAYAGSGVLGLTTPESLGGRSGDLVSLVALFEGLGYGGGDPGILFALAAQLLSVQYPILKFGSEEQKSSFLPRLISCELRAAHAATEADSGSDIFSIRSSALACSGGYLLSGSKTYITGAPVADIALVLASTQPERKGWGLSAFLVDLNSKGVRRGGNIDKMGLKSAEFGEIEFHECFVPEGRRLGSEGSGLAIFKYALDMERSFILAPVLGIMRLQMERAICEANRRKRQGRTIGNFQSVSNRIADMQVRLELSRMAIYQAAAMKDAGQSAKVLSSVIKLAVSEFFLASSLDEVRIAGANGYISNSPAEATLRDSVGGLFYSGTSDVLRNIIAHSVGVIDDRGTR